VKRFRESALCAILILCHGVTEVHANERADLIRNLKQDHKHLRSSSADVLVQGDFRDLTTRYGYAFRTFASHSGERFLERTVDPNSESAIEGATVTLIRPHEITVLNQQGPGLKPHISRVKPNGLGAYDQVLDSNRIEKQASEACWAVHGVDIMTLLTDPKVTILDTTTSVDDDNASVVKVRFDASTANYPFDRGEFQFRPDLIWSLSSVKLIYSTNRKTGIEHSETTHITAKRWTDGAVFPSEIERTVEYPNRQTAERTYVSFTERSDQFERNDLFDVAYWTRNLTSGPMSTLRTGPLDSSEFENEHAQTAEEPRPLPARPPSENVVRIMKFASPASGILSTLMIATLFDRFRRRSKR
jgi:hypothetical protein